MKKLYNIIMSGVGTAIGKIISPSTKYITFAAILAIFGAGFYWYYTDTQNRLQENAAIIANQEIAIAIEKNTISQMELDIETHKYILKEVYKDLEEARKQVDVDPFSPKVWPPEHTPTAPNGASEPAPVVPPAPSTVEDDIRNQLGGTEDELNKNFNNSTKCFELYSRDKKDDDDKKLRVDCGLSD